MDLLHATWRMEYVAAPRAFEERAGESSPFAAMLAAEDDEANLVLWRGSHTFIVLNRFPYNAGHLLVLPKREVASLAALTAEERLDLMDALVLGQEALRRALNPDGYNIGLNLGHAAGAGIPKHLHIHVVPRWEGDTNFMPVLGDTRVLPEALARTWHKLREHLAAAAAAHHHSHPSPHRDRPVGGTTPPFP